MHTLQLRKAITAFVILTICSIIAVIPSPQARASEADVPPQLAGMEQFITVTDENRLSLDAENAKEADTQTIQLNWLPNN